MNRPSITKLLGIILTLLLLAIPAAAMHNIPKDFFCMQAHTLDGDTVTHHRTIDLMSQAGVKMIRDEIFWWNVEKEKGKLIIQPRTLQNIDYTRSKGIEVLLILDYGNKLYDQGLSPHTPEGRQAFAKYCYTVVSTLRGRVNRFEIWNEPNIDGFWTPKPNVKDYALLLETAYKACKEANPDCVIIGGVTSGVDLTYLEELFKLGGIQYMDVLSLHPYRQNAPEMGEKTVDQLIKAQQLTVKYNKPLRLWVTEMGYPTHTGANGHPESRQAAYLSRCYLEILSTGLVDHFFWYWFGPDGKDATYSEDRFGLVRENWTLKPGYSTYSSLALQLAGSRFLQHETNLGVGVKAMTFIPANTRGRLTYCWNTAEDAEKPQSSAGFTAVTWSTKSREVTVTEVGKSERNTYQTINGQFMVPVSQTPVLIQSPLPLVPARTSLIQLSDTKFNAVAGLTRNLTVKLHPGLAQKLTQNLRLGNKITITTLPRDIVANPDQMLLLNPKDPIFTKGRTIQLHIPTMDKMSTGIVDISLYSEGKPVATAKVLLEVGPAAKASIQPFINDDEKGINVIITNLTGKPGVDGKSLDGEVFLTVDADVLLDKPDQTFTNLKPGKETVLSYRFLEMGDLEPDATLPVEAKVFLTGMDIFSVNKSINYMVCPKSTNPLTIDGDPQDWNLSTPIHLNRLSQVFTGKSRWKGLQDSHANIYLNWDETHLYVLADVSDDVLSFNHGPSREIYRNDAVELFFDGQADGSKSPGTYQSDDSQWGLSNTPKGPVVWTWTRVDAPSKASMIGYSAKTDTTNPGYYLEAAIPFSELGFKPAPGKLIGFAVNLDDDDTPDSTNPFEQDKVLGWAGTKSNWMDPSQFGYLFFTE